MKLLSTADWHLGTFPGPEIQGQNARLMDTLRCADFLVQKAQEEQSDVILIAGDLFDKAKLWADNMLMLIDMAAKRLRALAAVAPTVLMLGTSTHDNPQAFENIRDMRIPDLHVITNPQFFTINTESGRLQIAALPGLDKNHFRTLHPGMDPAEENQKCSQLLGDLVLGLGAQVDPSIPSVLIAHYSVAGCEMDNGQTHIFTQNEVILPREAIAASPFDLVCLGHIHKGQEVPHCGRPVFYSGSINGLTFNEEWQDKGFWMHEIGVKSPVARSTSRFIKTPSREFITEKWGEWTVEGFINGGKPGPGFRDAIVRLHYSCSDELNKQLNRKALEKALYEAGAFYVAEIKPVQVVAALAKQEMTENAGPLENLWQWCAVEGITAEDADKLGALALPLIDIVSAKAPTGRLSGVFVPRSIMVKNYRSYREAVFDFDPITFATVNGPNGVGKSALFMDAISDCLYEETREGDLTGWITNGEKSGSITFEFSMGESVWRVVRTRSRSGRTTVTLQERVNSQWADRGADKVRDTQEKIVALLGMDALTFRCCGLIMQDAYGLFLEADREDRMTVFGNILGLGAYEQLERLAKEKGTETNRELQRAKDKLAELDEKLKAMPGLQAELVEVGAELDRVIGDITVREAEQKEAEELVRSLTAKAEKAEELRRQIEALTAEVDAKVVDRAEQIKRSEKAQSLLEQEDEILGKAAEYETVKEQVAVLRAKAPRLKEVETEKARIVNEMIRVDREILRLSGQIKAVEAELSFRTVLERDDEKYRLALDLLKEIETLGDKHEALRKQIMAIERVTDKIAEPLNTKYEILKACREKVAFLNDSNCIDVEKASCRFLADAVKSKLLIPRIESEIDEILKQRIPYDEQIKAAEQESDAVGYNCEEHCRVKSLADELRPKAEAFARLSGKAELLNNLKCQQEQRQEESKQLAAQVGEKDGAITALLVELKPLADLENSLPKLEPYVKAKDQLPVARQIVTTATERIAELDLEIADKHDQAGGLEQGRHLLLVETAGLNEARRDVSDYHGYINTYRDLQNQFHAIQGGMKARLDALEQAESERRNVSSDMAPLAATLTRYQTLAKAFGQDGIPFSIVRAAVPELSAHANEILGQMTGGKMSLEMKTEKVQKSNKKEVNALEIWINDYLWGNMPYKSRSGGQKVRAALSVAFALAELKAQRAGIRLGMLAIDEPSFLDQQGSEVYIDALEAIANRYTGMKVIAISHDPMMKARFPQVILVSDDGEAGSKVQLVV